MLLWGEVFAVGTNCVIEKVNDIGDVAEVESYDGEGGIVKRVVVGEIDGVLSAEDVYCVMLE